jgi:hypothetical protein
MKIQAAMFGANIILLTNQRTEGNKYGGYFQSSSTTETNLTGIAYSNILPDLEKFKSLIGVNKTFFAVKKFELGASDSDVSAEDINDEFNLMNVVNENGIITIEGQLKSEKRNTMFQLANFTGDSFSIAYKYKGAAYNYTIKI